MSKAFVGEHEPLLVPAKRKLYAEPRDLIFALEDLKREGPDNLEAIAADYGIPATMLANRYARSFS